MVLVYRGVYESEAGRYAGAEPELAGMAVASPFCVLVLLQIACAVGVYALESGRARAACAVAALVVTGLGGWAAMSIVAA